MKWKVINKSDLQQKRFTKLDSITGYVHWNTINNQNSNNHQGINVSHIKSTRKFIEQEPSPSSVLVPSTTENNTSIVRKKITKKRTLSKNQKEELLRFKKRALANKLFKIENEQKKRKELMHKELLNVIRENTILKLHTEYKEQDKITEYATKLYHQIFNELEKMGYKGIDAENYYLSLPINPSLNQFTDQTHTFINC